MSFKKQFDQSIKPERHRNGALSMHPYFGKLDPALARTLITSFSDEGQIVLDPFCGSGTVLHEAVLLKRSAIGWDSSPLAILLAQAKLLGIYPDELGQLRSVINELEPYVAQGSLFSLALPNERIIPDMPRIQSIDSWFEANALQELGFLRSYLVRKLPTLMPGAAILLQTAFSRIIVMASNQQGESSYRRVKKKDYPGRVISLFLEAIKSVADSADKFRHIVPFRTRAIVAATDTHCQMAWDDTLIHLYLHDTTSSRLPDQFIDKKADLVVTSPPYLMSWDYGLYHKFRFYWLGFDLDQYEQTEIGRHLRRKQDDVEQYRENMTMAFKGIGLALKAESRIALINAPSIVHGKEIDTNAILEECASVAGWRLDDCVATIDIPGPHHGMYASLKQRGTATAGQVGKKEHVLIFSRTHI